MIKESSEFIPHKYQGPMIKGLKENIHGLLCFPGSGKTPSALESIYYHKEPTLIIAPIAILYSVWQFEHLKWNKFKNLKVSILHGKNRDANFSKRAGIYLINPQSIPWLIKKIESTRKFPWTNLIIDESIAFKNPKSKRFKLLKKMLKTFKRRYILTGNITPNTMEDIWAQIFILDLGKRLGKSPYSFRNKYFYPTDYMRFNWELKPGAEEEIIKKISDIVTIIRVNDTDLDLPERVIIDIEYELPSKARKIYKVMEDDLFFNLTQYDNDEFLTPSDDDDFILAPSRGVALMKCQQIANGFLYETQEDPDIKRRTLFLHDINLELVKEKVLELNSEPCIIVYNFEEDRIRLTEAFPTAPIATNKNIKEIEDGWNSNKFPIILAHLNKLSHGLNLQQSKGKTIIMYSLTYNYDVFDQLCYRLQRQGSTHNRIVIMRLVAINTVHEAMISSLNSKGNMSKNFIQQLINYKRKIECQHVPINK